MPKGNKEKVENQIAFARALLKMRTYDPKNSASRQNRTFSLYTKENIIQWLQNPSSGTNEKNLRNASIYMYLSSMHYRRLLSYYAGLYTGAYVIAPLNFNKTDVKDSFIKQYKKVSKALELMNLPTIMRTIALVALREGAFYGVLLSDNTSAFIQQINPDYCKITSICDGSFLYSVDMTKVATTLEFYPPEFTEMYTRYLETGEQWQEVPVDVCVCVKGDDSLIDLTIPPFASVMPSLYTLANMGSLQETASELRNYKMLAGKLPTDEKGNIQMDSSLVEQYYSHIANNLDEHVGLVLSPFKLESFGFENKSGTVDFDDFSNATSNFWSTAGTSGLLHGKENNTSGVTKLAIKNDETFVLPIIQQFERVINRYLKSAFSGSVKFKITILPITVFNKDEMLKFFKEGASFGIGKSYYAAALGIPQNDVAGLDYLEKEIIHFDELTPLKNSYTTGGSDAEAGRPASSESDISDAGEKTRDNDTNSNQ